MSPERDHSQQEALSNAEWNELSARLPLMSEVAESVLYKHQSDQAETAVLTIEQVDTNGSQDQYYIYRVENGQNAMTMYSLDPSARRIQVYGGLPLDSTASLGSIYTQVQFDQITESNTPNAQNLRGLREFLAELRDQDELFSSAFGE